MTGGWYSGESTGTRGYGIPGTEGGPRGIYRCRQKRAVWCALCLQAVRARAVAVGSYRTREKERSQARVSQSPLYSLSMMPFSTRGYS